MNFQEFYTKTENRLTDAILSLWATGDKEMQNYFKYLLSQEPIIADAVFQNTFPWEQGNLTFGETTNFFDQKFINALSKIKDEDFRFPKGRKPYKHQLKSWQELLNQKKSIAVTTGTGSGKTECFMLPVIQDIYKNCRNQQGVNAIFLYPLNALIASQRKRMHAWCSALDGVNYALLTGDTPNSVRSLDEKKKALPQLISRKQIRETPPQVLFTNPTMLEYMLVRNADTPILEKSQGKLRWILLDEAHTLTGSKAVEMALLIRRVAIAFGVDIKDVRFAITSATVGNGNTDALKKFMADLCGISIDQIVVIQGERINSKIADENIPHISDKLSKNNIKFLRNQLLNSAGLTQNEIGKTLKITNKSDQFKAIDTLAEQQVNEENLLPVRGHFFTRGIGGIYVCTSSKCDKHKGNKPDKALGTMYTVAGKKCSCGHPLLELVACRSCGNMMLEGERLKGNHGTNKASQKASIGYEAFHMENDDTEQEITNGNLVRFIKNKEYQKLKNQDLISCTISENNDIISGDDFFMVDGNKCPHCGSQNENPMHFRISSVFTNRILSDIVLDQTQDANHITPKTLYNGKKYISFTDSRQGTAKIAALINIDSESDWIRYQVYHFLLKKLKDNQSNRSKKELLEERAYHISQIDKAPPFMKKEIEEKIAKINNLINSGSNDSLSESRSSWKEIIDFIKDKDAFKTLFKKGAKGENIVIQNDTYAKAILYDQFARRLQRERSLENLGLVNIVYPSLDTVILSEIAKELKINKEEWKNLLKIAADYVIRNNINFFFDDSLRLFTTKFYHSVSLHASTTEIANAKKWPSYNPKSRTQSRLVLLLCAGLGWHNREDITKNREDQLNELLEKLWRILREKLLIKDGEGYKLDFFEKTAFEIAGNEFLCPVSNRLIDKVFRGYSPWIKGNLEEENIYNYKIDDHKNHTFPAYDYPFHLSKENEAIHPKDQEKWLTDNSRGARDKGLWNNLHERIFDFGKLYLAGEHSAQQDRKRLKELELQFEKGEINILSCSTTMEMGVDIGGISAVVMSNVPPMPANYLQRTGRAGRRSENKSLALTFCAPNPIGMRTMNNPKWALEHKIASPILAFDSKNIVERHVNSLLFGIFIRHHENDNKGLNVKENIETFFYDGTPTMAENFLNWLKNNGRTDLENQLKYLVKDTPLVNRTPEQLIAMVIDNFKKTANSIKKQRDSFDKKLEDVAKEFGNNSPAFKAVSYRKGQFLQKFVLAYLAQDNFLPNAGLPTGIVDFEKTTLSDLNKKNQTKFKSNPSYSISRALTEFAPGNNILIDGLNYKSSGIVLKNNWGQTAERNLIQACKNCGYQRTIGENSKIDEDCIKCHSKNSFIGIDLGDHKGSFTELVEPSGFSIDLFAQPTRVISERSKPQYLEPLLLNIDPWKQNQSSYLDFRTSEQEDDAEILFYNTGDGEGYSLCLDCGRVENSHERLEGHKRLRGGKDNDGESLCSAQNIHDHIILGSKFKTDFSEIRLKNTDESFVNDKKLTYSLGVIFTKSLAEHLAIEESELGFGIKKYKGYQTIFIYDTAKGGAGYASQLRIYSKEILEQALEVLDNCTCQNACTRCLIDRSSQWHMEDLDRHIAIEWLRAAIENQLPKELLSNKFKVSSIFGSLNDEIKRLDYHHGIKEVNIHINNKVEDWEIDDLEWIENLKRDRITTNLIVEGEIAYSNNQEKLSVYLLSHNYNLKIGIKDKILEYAVQLTIELDNSTTFNYISKSDYDNLDAVWSKESEEKFFKVESGKTFNYKPLLLPVLTSGNLYEAKISTFPRNSQSNDLVKIMTVNLHNSQDLLSNIKGKSFKVSYYDKYNQSEFSMRLTLQFINQIKVLWSVEIEELYIHLSNEDFKNYKYPNFIIHNYKELADYEYDLKELSNAYDFEVNIVNESRLPHYRYFEFNSKDVSFSIRIDGGIAHGLKPVKRLTSEELKLENEVFEIRKDVGHDIIYNISFEK